MTNDMSEPDSLMDDMSEHQKTLRIVRFFLPRLGRQQLANEIEAEKDRLRHESEARKVTITSEAGNALADLGREKERDLAQAMGRIAEIRREGEDRVRQDTAPLQSHLTELNHKRDRDIMILLSAFLVVIVGIVLTSAVESSLFLFLSATGVVGLIWAFIDGWSVLYQTRTCRQEITTLETAIREEISRWTEDEETVHATRLAEYEALMRLNRDTMRADLAAEQERLAAALGALDARLVELIRLYEESVASEDEVIAFAHTRLAELQELVAPALGLDAEDILDERSAEVWAPSFLQNQELPPPVVRDVEQSEQEIAGWADDIIQPMRTAVPTEQQWQAFRGRVLRILGLLGEVDDSDQEEPVRMNSLRAVRFSTTRQTYLAGHYFYQKIVCAEDMIGLFRAYLNVLNRRVPNTFALQILYSDIAAIGIETSYNREHFDIASMTIDQHTHTLTLELSSGSNYRMSGDAGSAGLIRSAGDVEVEKVVSQANQDFRDQVVNVRALIRDMKRSAATDPLIDSIR